MLCHQGDYINKECGVLWYDIKKVSKKRYIKNNSLIIYVKTFWVFSFKVLVINSGFLSQSC